MDAIEKIERELRLLFRHSSKTWTSEKWRCAGAILVKEFEQLGYRLPEQTDKREAVKKELPKLTNNNGCMSKGEIEDFATMVLTECGYPYTMKWTTAGDIMIEPFIYIDERHIDEYPYMAKERVLHEVAHIDTHSLDDRHGEIFHARLAELIIRFMTFGTSLLTPELKLIGDGKIQKIFDGWYMVDINAMANGTERPDSLQVAKDVAQAQLDSCNKQLREG